MLKERIQRLVHTHVDPDTREKVCIDLESDILKLINDEVEREALQWKSQVMKLQNKITSLEKRARIVQLANFRHLKRAL